MMITIFKVKGDVMNLGSCIGVKLGLLKHALKIVERVFERRIRALVNQDKMQFRFLPEKGTTDALFILKKIKEEYRKKEKEL